MSHSARDAGSLSYSLGLTDPHANQVQQAHPRPSPRTQSLRDRSTHDFSHAGPPPLCASIMMHRGAPPGPLVSPSDVSHRRQGGSLFAVGENKDSAGAIRAGYSNAPVVAISEAPVVTLTPRRVTSRNSAHGLGSMQTATSAKVNIGMLL